MLVIGDNSNDNDTGVNSNDDRMMTEIETLVVLPQHFFVLVLLKRPLALYSDMTLSFMTEKLKITALSECTLFFFLFDNNDSNTPDDK